MSAASEHVADLEQLKRALAALKKLRAQLDAVEQSRREPIAIVGIGCRLPGAANTPEAFWQLLRNGVDAIQPTPPERWDGEAFYGPDPNVPGKAQTRYGGFIRHIDQFDPHFFGIAPREAAAMDPQQRLILEVAWEALEDAGLVPDQLAGSRAGVFIGIGLNDYGRLQIPAQARDRALIDNYFLTGNALCITPNRLSYLLDLRGPSLAIDTACSSSLVALHQACHSLRNGESTLALVGGVNVMLAPDNTVGIGKFLSADGRCKFGDARADGYVRAEGAAMVVLKPLSRAQADGDHIYALIRGSAVNQDGYSSGLTVPNGVAQQAVLRDALQNAGVAGAQLDYVEAHGTGTSLGDPIELNALQAVLSQGRAAGSRCAVGSVKTNIGHLEAGAGLAGVVKLALALQHGEIPPSLHYETPNPHIPFDEMCLYVPRTLTPWPQTDHRPLAGVSSFGFGGTNAHVVMEAAPYSGERESRSGSPAQAALAPPPPATARAEVVERPAHVLTLSARNEAGLRELAQRYAGYFRATPDAALGDVAFSATTGRTHFAHRLAVPAASIAELGEKLSAFASGQLPTGASQATVTSKTAPRIAFAFTGQGAQYVGMGRQLYETQPVFRAALDRCAELLEPQLDAPLLNVLFDDHSSANGLSRLDQTAYTQPALFALEYALAEMWRSWGVEPAAVLGHSVGEYVAACVAGVFSLEDGLRLIAERGRLMGALPAGGAMAAVFADQARVAEAIAPYAGRVAIAAINGPSHIVISGESEVVEAVLAALAQSNIKARRLKVSHAFHSPLMEPMLADFERFAQGITYHAPRVQVFSNLTGRPLVGAPDAGIPDARYWRRHVREAVQFAPSVVALHQTGVDLFVEIGPAPTLSGMGTHCLPEGAAVWLPSLRPNQDDWRTVLQSLGALHVRGVSVDWAAFDKPYARRKVPLPTYPFQRQRYWFSPDIRRAATSADHAGPGLHPLLGHRVESPALHAHVYEVTLGVAELPLLDGHRVFGRAVFPATGYVEMARAAAEEAFGRFGSIEELLIQEALVLPDEAAQTVQIVLAPLEAGEARFEIYFQAAANWRLCASGRLNVAPSSATTPAVTLAEAQARCPHEQPAADFYRALAGQGMGYSGAFQSLRQVWREAGAGRAALGVVQLPEAESAQPYGLHPALLDAALQVLGAALPVVDGAVYLPLSLHGVRVYESLRGRVWSFATLEAGEAETATGSVRVFGDDGRLLAEVERIHLKRASRTALARIAGRAAAANRDWFFEVDWTPRPLSLSTTQTPAPGRWLILADRTGVGAALAARLGDCAIVYAGEAYERQGERQWQVNAAEPDHFRRLVAETGRIDGGVIHLWSLDVVAHRDAPAWARSQQLACGSLLHLIQAFPADDLHRLWLVTRGAQPALAPVRDTSVLNAEQATLWGLRRTLPLEYPGVESRCVDLDPHSTDADSAAGILWREISAPEAEEEIAWRGAERFVSRLVPATARPLSNAEATPQRLEVAERGVFDNLRLAPATRRPPGPGEVEIRVQAAGLNFRDVLNTLGLYPGEAGLLGQECVGEVTALGAGVSTLRAGERVMVVASGSFSTFVTTRAELAVQVPAALSAVEAATLPITFLTADFALRHLANVQRGERVLIHAAAGGVGLAAVQLALQTGAEVFATAGSAEKRAYLQSLGVSHVMDSRTLDFADEVLMLTDGAGVDIVLNSLTGDFIPKSLSALRRGGRFLEIGKRDIWSAEQVAALGRDIAYSIIYLGEVCDADPELIQTMLRRVATEFEAGRLRPLPRHIFPIESAAEAFRFMAQARHIGKIVLTLPRPAPRSGEREALRASPAQAELEPAPVIRSDASYLITGGMSGLGLQTARWLAENGARHLALVGRRAPDESTRAVLAHLEGQGVHTLTLQADISLGAEVARVLAEVERSLPPLRGIVHAAGVLDDGVLAQQTWARFEKVMAPKVAGAWHLHTQTRAKALDFFVLYSAGAALLGSAGQGNYTAANAYLDALAHARRAEGLPALSLNWGSWDEVGMAANLSERDRQRLARRGLSALSPEQGMQALQHALGLDCAQLAVLPMDWQQFAQANQTGRMPALFAAVTTTSPAAGPQRTAAASGPGLREQLAEAPAARRRALIQSHVRRQAAHVLGLDEQFPMDPGQPLNEIGLDSLMAVELRNALGAGLEHSLSATLLFDYPTLEALADYLARELLPAQTAKATEAVPTPDTDRRAEVAAAVAALSEEEAEALLLQELAELKQGSRNG